MSRPRITAAEAHDKSRGCPLWWKTTQTNAVTGEIKVWEECGHVQLPLYLTEVIKAANRPAAAIESTRNEIAQGLARVAAAAGQGVFDVPALEHTGD